MIYDLDDEAAYAVRFTEAGEIYEIGRIRPQELAAMEALPENAAWGEWAPIVRAVLTEWNGRCPELDEATVTAVATLISEKLSRCA